MIELILGGAYSGKSRYAEELAEERVEPDRGEVVYVATGRELAADVDRRLARLGSHWRLVEEDLALAEVLEDTARGDTCVIIDDLTLWLENLLAEGDSVLDEERDALLDLLPELPGELILVHSEVGLGLRPEASPLPARLREESGYLAQDLAALAGRVQLVVAGLPVPVKGGTAHALAAQPAPASASARVTRVTLETRRSSNEAPSRITIPVELLGVAVGMLPPHLRERIDDQGIPVEALIQLAQNQVSPGVVLELEDGRGQITVRLD